MIKLIVFMQVNNFQCDKLDISNHLDRKTLSFRSIQLLLVSVTSLFNNPIALSDYLLLSDIHLIFYNAESNIRFIILNVYEFLKEFAFFLHTVCCTGTL